jgi:hypothetical protein
MSKIKPFKLLHTSLKVSVSAMALLFVFACAEEGKRSEQDSQQEEKETEKKNSNLFEISGKVFSIPSPIQTAFLLKNVGTTYSSELLNPTTAVTSYSTTDKKALNLGIYGADLGYATIYDQTQDAISYMAVTKRLTSDLGISGLFNETMMKRFENNLGNMDSLLVLVSDAFKSADSYLKNNKQHDLSVLILAGGWIETLHFATSLAKTTDNQALKNRIGEQKITIKNLIKLLLPFQENEEVASVINQLNELKDIYNNISFSYTYVEPETDAENKTTMINSESNVDMTKEQLDNITAKVAQIRNGIVQ